MVQTCKNYIKLNSLISLEKLITELTLRTHVGLKDLCYYILYYKIYIFNKKEYNVLKINNYFPNEK